MNAAIAPETLDWATIWQEYRLRIYAFVRARVRKYGSTDELAEDLTSEVFARAIAADKRGKGPHSHLSSWLFRIARNLVFDHYRAVQRSAPTIRLDAIAFEDTDDAGTCSRGETATTNEPTPHELAEQAIVCERVRGAVSHLCGEQGHVVARRMDDFDFDEIATELDKSIGATKALQHRAYENLRMWLKEVA